MTTITITTTSTTTTTTTTTPPPNIAPTTSTVPTTTLTKEALEALLYPLTVPTEELYQITKAFSKTFHDLARCSTEQFLPTPITALPDGTEKGKFLVLDIGGTNLRVAVVELFGAGHGGAKSETLEPKIVEAIEHIHDKISSSSLSPINQIDPEYITDRLRVYPQATWEIPVHLKTSTEILFDWVGECIAFVIRAYLSKAKPSEVQDVMENGITLGVSFSFPMIQSTHTSAILMAMGKGFKLEGNKDLASLLSNGYQNLRNQNLDLPKLEVVAITNDSISTQLAGGYVHNGRSIVGIIGGTGTNATCLCPVGKLAEAKRPQSSSAQTIPTHVLMNTEWSINGTLPPLEKYITSWDKALDRGNEKPGFQPFEEMIGGRYLGELVRLVSLDVLPTRSKRLPSKFYDPYAIETKLCSQAEEHDDIQEVISLLTDYFDDDIKSGWKWDVGTATIFRNICEVVSTRAAALLAAATVGILDVNDDLLLNSQMDLTLNKEAVTDIVISYTGTVLEKYFQFKERCQRFINNMVRLRYNLTLQKAREVGLYPVIRYRRNVTLVESKEGGVVGAAVLAAMVKNGRT